MTVDVLLQVLENFRDRIEAIEATHAKIVETVTTMIESSNRSAESHKQTLAAMQKTIRLLQDDDPNAFLRDSLREDPDQ